MNKKDTLLKGTFILVSAQFISKFLGFIYKAILSRVIGSVGMGIYEKVYPLYTMLLTISIVGIPVAISKLVAEKRAEDREAAADYIFKVALKINLVFGFIASLLVGALAAPLARYLLDDINVMYSIWGITPAILVVSVMATYRGYFQGRKQMFPTALSQVSEQVIRMLSMIILSYILMTYGVEYGAAGAASGAFFGSLAGLASILFLYYRFQKNRDKPELIDTDLPPVKQVLNRIFSLALPVTIGALILPLMRLIDASLITRRLRVAGMNLERATSLYGQFNGMAMTLVRFPTVVAASLAVNLVPTISEAYTLGQEKLVKSRIFKSFKLALYVSLPSVIGLFVLARPLCKIIFATPEAAVSLRYVAFGVVVVSLQQITSSILQGFDRPKLPAKNLFLGAGLNAGLNYYLTAIPALGIRGAAIGTISGFTLAAALNLRDVFSIVKLDFDYNQLIIKPIFSSGIMGVLVYFVYHHFIGFAISEVVVTLSAVLVGIVSYLMILLLSGGLTPKDLSLIPKVGDKLVVILERLGIFND